MFEIFVTVENMNASNLLSGKRHLSGLDFRPATLKILSLIISKWLTICSNCGIRSSASQHSIVQLLIWNGMKSDANIAAHLSIGPKLSGHQHLRFRCFFTSIWWITVDMLVISVVERYFRLGWKYLFPLKKVNLLYINYCTNYIH